MCALINSNNHSQALTANQACRNYQLPPTILKHLPWAEFDNDDQCVLLQDTSVGAAFELSLIPSEAKPEKYLRQLRGGFQGIFQDTFPQYSDEELPWIIQCYVQDDVSLSYLYQLIQSNIKPTAQDSLFKDTYLDLIKNYCQWLSQNGGVFHDDKVTDSSFRGGRRTVRVAIYRQYSKKMALRRGQTAVQDLNQVAMSFLSKLNSVGVSAQRLNGNDFRDWLIGWFNPRPAITQGNTQALLDAIKYPNTEEQPFGYDFSQQLFYSVPRSDQHNGVWYFDGLPHRYRQIQHLTRVPDMGHLTRECSFGNYRYGLLDKFPEGATFVMTVMI